nr:MAG TPA: hypothetical protein [Caudoviricetes sp.]
MAPDDSASLYTGPVASAAMCGLWRRRQHRT